MSSDPGASPLDSPHISVHLASLFGASSNIHQFKRRTKSKTHQLIINNHCYCLPNIGWPCWPARSYPATWRYESQSLAAMTWSINMISNSTFEDLNLEKWAGNTRFGQEGHPIQIVSEIQDVVGEEVGSKVAWNTNVSFTWRLLQSKKTAPKIDV